jgi:4-hydroxy-tetrahydrodipicolinate synthase
VDIVDIRGSIVALVTPMHADGAVDWERLRKLVDWHVEQGTHAIVAVGTTGESATLGFEEHDLVIREVISAARGRVPIIAGTGANSTEEAIRLTRDARRDGADACLLVTPYYNKPTQEGLYQHHLAIARAVDIPQILYNVPGRTACDMLPETVERLSRVDNIVGIKEATGNLERIREIRERCGPEFLIYSGDDATAVEAMLMGAQGDISVTANVAPSRMATICEAALAGDAARARELDAAISILHRDLFVESNPIPVKWALQQMGLIDAGIRLPLTPLSAPAQQVLRASLAQCGLL